MIRRSAESFDVSATGQDAQRVRAAGAYASYFLFEGLGSAPTTLPGRSAPPPSCCCCIGPSDQPWLRVSGGWFRSSALRPLLSMAVPWLSPGPVMGSGGYVGAVGRTVLQTHLASAGAYLVVISVFVCGLLLCSDYLVLRATACAVGVPARAVGRVARARAAAGAARRAEPRTDLEEEVVRDLAVRIRGKVVEPARGDSEEPADEEADEESAAPAASAASEEKAEDERQIRVRPVKRGDRQEVMEALDAASRADNRRPYELPSIEMLVEGEPIHFEEHEKEVRRKAKILEKTFHNFGFNVKVVEIETGPVIAQFEIELEEGLRLSKITSLADDIAIALRVPSVRIVAPIPGKNTVGVEVPNAERQVVRLREVIEEANAKSQKMRIPIYLGKDVAGNPMVADLTTLPHLLIAGRTARAKACA